MKSLKSVSLIAMMLLLAACGGHGFEGDYKSEADSSIELVDAFADIAGSHTLVIGSNYIESEGERTTFNDIFVRESAGERYLVFKSAEKEDVWKIIDDNTLMKGNDLMSLKLVRISNN